MSLIGTVLKALAKSVLIPWELTAAGSTTDAATHKKMFGSGTATFSNKVLNDIMKIIGPLKESSLLVKDIGEIGDF